MKFTAKPVEVKAQRIMSLAPLTGDAVKPGQSKATLEDGSEVAVHDDDGAEVGAFLVTWPDGEKSSYPAEEFEQRFAPSEVAQKAA